MKRILALILAILMLSTALVACNGDTPDNSNNDTENKDDSTNADNTDGANTTFYAGFARESITPEGSHPLQGYPQARPSEGVHDEIMLTCTAIKDSTGKIVLFYSVDAESVYSTRLKEFKEAVIKACPEVKYNDIVFSATHSHYTPNATNNQVFVDLITEKAVVTAKAAIADLSETEIYYGTNNVENLNWVRRYYTDENGVYKHQFEADQTMPIVKFARKGKKDIVLVNWAAHADTLGQNLISADYVHYMRKTVEEGSDVHFMVQMGATGNVNPFSAISSENYVSGTEQYGTELGNLINKFLKKEKNFTKVETTRTIESKSQTIPIVVDRSLHHLFNKAIDLEAANGKGDSNTINRLLGEMGGLDLHSGLAIARRGRLNDVDTMTLSVITVGEIAFAIAPYEMFAETGMNLKKASPYKHTMICATSNGFYSYIPTDAAFDFSSYEVNITYYERGTAEKIEATLIDLFQKLYK